MKLLLAYCSYQSGQEDKAIANYREAADLDPESSVPYIHLGALSAQNKDGTTAISSYETALKKSPDDVAVANNLAMVLLRRGEDEDIERAYFLVNQLIQNNSDNSLIMDIFG